MTATAAEWDEKEFGSLPAGHDTMAHAYGGRCIACEAPSIFEDQPHDCADQERCEIAERWDAAGRRVAELARARRIAGDRAAWLASAFGVEPF